MSLTYIPFALSPLCSLPPSLPSLSSLSLSRSLIIKMLYPEIKNVLWCFNISAHFISSLLRYLGSLIFCDIILVFTLSLVTLSSFPLSLSLSLYPSFTHTRTPTHNLYFTHFFFSLSLTHTHTFVIFGNMSRESFIPVL